MGQYNFDQILDRTHTKSLKYDFAVKRGKPADVLPFWVADMDFEVPPELKQILLVHVLTGYQTENGSLKRQVSYLPWLWRFALSLRKVKGYLSTNLCIIHSVWLLMITIAALLMCRLSKAKKNILLILKVSRGLSLRKT